MLACRRFPGSHTAENVLTVYQEIVADFSLEHKVSSIITDNAANMIKAFVTLPGTECLADDSASDEEDDATEQSSTPIPSHNLNHLPHHIPCFLHTLQLVVQDGLAELGNVQNAILRGARLVKYVRRSCLATEVFGDVKLQARNDTRWNSTVKMLKSLVKAEAILAEKLTYPSTVKPLTAYDLKAIKEVIDILTPFELATDQCQGEYIITASMVIPCIRGLRAELEELGKKSSKLASTLKSSLERRLSRYEQEEALQMAAALDPRLKLDWCHDEERAAVKELVKDKVLELAPEKHQLASETAPPAKRCRLFRFMKKSTAMQPQEDTCHVEKYFREPAVDDSDDPLDYWKVKASSMPELAKLAVTYLAPSASSAPVERMFSIAGKIFRPDRCRLSDARFEELMFIRCNKQRKY